MNTCFYLRKHDEYAHKLEKTYWHLSPAPLPSSTNLDSDSLSSPARLSVSLSECEEQLDRLQQVELARTAPMCRWRAGTVQAWLEVIMAMPMYIRACTDNVKSGKVDV